MLSLLSRAVGRRPRREEIGDCPGCGRPVARDDERVRLRGEAYAHSRCATYNVRRMSAYGRDRTGRPLGAGRASSPPLGTD